MDLSIVVPVYRSAITLPMLASRLTDVLNSLGLDYEIIFVDDASSDNSWDVLVQLQREHPKRIAAIQLMRNFGQHNALMCGFKHARGRYIITLDDDLQHPPEEIRKLYEAIERTGADVIYGNPRRKEHEKWRNAGSTLVGIFYRIVFENRIQPSPFRILRKEAVDAILTYSLNYTYVDGLLAWNTQRIGSVLVNHEPRQQGRSGYSLWKLFTLALNLFTNFSLLPLQLVSALGLCCAVGAHWPASIISLSFSWDALKSPAMPRRS